MKNSSRRRFIVVVYLYKVRRELLFSLLLRQTGTMTARRQWHRGTQQPAVT